MSLLNSEKPAVLSVCLLLLLFFVLTADASEEFAVRTGAACAVCHLDPLGGGELSERGQGYRLSLGIPATEAGASRTTFSKTIKLLFGYLHIVTGFLWFGTILYVHLVLKPAYASKGLPRGEVRVGLASMLIMAVSGAVLTYYKVPSPGLLVTSRFGILLLAKIAIFLIMAASALVAVLVIGPRLRGKKVAGQPGKRGELTPAVLAGFDGLEGRPAYVAYQGKVYDVSGSKLWRNGEHMKRHQAGGDLTEVLSQAPHGEEKFEAVPIVGRLIPDKDGRTSEAPKKLFFFIAYMNLGFVFAISLIIALWRWL